MRIYMYTRRSCASEFFLLRRTGGGGVSLWICINLGKGAGGAKSKVQPLRLGNRPAGSTAPLTIVALQYTPLPFLCTGIEAYKSFGMYMDTKARVTCSTTGVLRSLREFVRKWYCTLRGSAAQRSLVSFISFSGLCSDMRLRPSRGNNFRNERLDTRRSHRREIRRDGT